MTPASSRRDRRSRVLARLAIVATVLGATATVSVPANAASNGVSLPTGRACRASASPRPSTLVLSCADGNTYVADIRWRTWSAPAAVGVGRYTFNTCTPDCAGGTFLFVRVIVRASVIVHSLFTRLVLRRPDRSILTLNWSADHGFGTWDPTSTGFVLAFRPFAHEAALRTILTAKSATHSLTRLSLYVSPLDSTWVLYRAVTAVGGGQDTAEGYAHFVAGRWRDVFGPASGFCSNPGALPGVPVDVRTSLARDC